jgi:protein-S-isoprenylcysteine O-methyltransferase Ste14
MARKKENQTIVMNTSNYSLIQHPMKHFHVRIYVSSCARHFRILFGLDFTLSNFCIVVLFFIAIQSETRESTKTTGENVSVSTLMGWMGRGTRKKNKKI